MARKQYRFDVERFRREARRAGFTTTVGIADAARVSLRTVRRTFSGEECPSGRILLWMAEAGIDARKVWIADADLAEVRRCG